ncbi:protein NEOXANTHIN-DEFICIENT 1 isoform X2 [Nymphaea colorata]|uniref:protein NEOXANTHIN-DEFICIENT 1 isoform X2 n=1 Tax=Nymphaea colorata TaxID=210225 RepID=UPI00214EB4EA|nr:protein NEOXANTHIN-DEFICIENT 1 isoform X2 [Nymphaea colorata]
MEEAKSSRRYSLGPPWIFKGRALYQLHLVKADTVRALVPKDLRLVEAFGYTLGGMFLAHYEDSPAGAFDELVTIAGIVWNPPTSCAWASRVLVSSHEACQHGRKDVGLPSHYASFSKRIDAIETATEVKQRSFLNFLGLDRKNDNKQKFVKIEIMDTVTVSSAALCNISIPMTETNKSWMGPHIRMSLPSFSGNTDDNPHLLKYSCQISCSIRAVEPAKITATDSLKMSCGNECQIDDESSSTLASVDSSNSKNVQLNSSTENEERQRSISVLLSKPILALEFNHMTMQVDAPHIVIHKPSKMR